ncbi:MAG: tryptophan 7-halogenase, partial [Actinobacteria bacterium]|nr:tryptophan 7-halogenase [Actinomycetota bacterium]
AGSYLSKAGVDNLIIEKTTRSAPRRRRVGESLVPSTTRNFEDIGFLPVMERAGFVRKHGASWHPVSARSEVSIDFAEFPRPGADQTHTYHVDRGRFDELLLEHSESLGSEVMRGAEVSEVLFDDDGYARGVRIDENGSAVDIPAAMVLDCSGRSTLLGGQLGLRVRNPLLNRFAVSARFEDVHRGDNPRTADYIHIYLLPVDRGWVWQIPITETITSIGVVAERPAFGLSTVPNAAWFGEMVAKNPDLARTLEPATQVGELRTEVDDSYRMARFVGNGWMLLGDAARYVDPIFSSGVSIACESARYASEFVVKALETGDRSAAMLQPYEDRMSAGVTIWHEFIRLYYKLMHLFTFFIQSREYRQQIHQLLQGEVYDRAEAPVLEAMRTVIKTVESTPGH